MRLPRTSGVARGPTRKVVVAMRGRPAGARWAVPLLVVLAAALVALTGSALAGLPSPASVSAADPAEGTFIGPEASGAFDHTIRSRTFPCMDKTGTCSGFEIFAAQQYRWGSGGGSSSSPMFSG